MLSKEGQINEIVDIIIENAPYKSLWLVDAKCIAEALYKSGYCKQEVKDYVS